jgi:Ca2+-binding EF-hand superfamily protein
MDSFIILQPKGGLVEGVEGSTLLDSPIKPTTVGLKMIDAPNGVAIGLAYRINGCNLERILVTEDEDSASSIKVVGSCILSGGAVGAVHLKASPDGRLVAVACIDGSLQCYDSTATSISLRWSIPSAHSHVTPSISSPVSADRSYAACGSGPILALDFSPYDYNLVLVDATKGMTIYDARVAEPINLIPSSQQQLTENVSSASWCGSIATKEECDGAAIPIAIGRFDGSIAILSCNPNSYPSDVLEPISELGCPSEEDGSVCTHLNWTSDTFVAGICRVFPPEDDEEPDEDDEDDNADHEACLYVTTIDDSLNRCADWMEQGDVVPFFTVPKFGRHVFFTSFLPHTGGKLIAVGTNVGTDIGAISSKNDSDGINDICWQPVEFQEGATATTPTNEDDEFAFPLGISILQLSSSSFRLLLAATDGSLSIFEYQHINDPKYFSSPVLGSTADLPSDPLVTMIKSSSATSNSISPPQTPENASWVVVDENKDDDLEKSVTPALSTTTESTIEGVPSANTTNSGLSGSGFKPSTFGSGNVSGLTFGSPNSGGSPFASFGKKVDETSVFGAVSSLSATASPITSTPVKPTNAFRSTGTFGSSTPSSIGGFAGLSSGGGAFGSSNTPSPGGSAFGSSPFNAFSKSLTPVSTVGGFPVKPLFGQASAPPTGTGEPTTVSVSSPSSKSLATTTDVQPVTPISFSSTKTSDLTATESPRKEDGISSSAKVEELSRTEKAAALVFDQFDSASSGSVPVSTFEDMSEALGEGFHGDEYDAQVNLVDPSKSGEISRSAFLTWYKSLVEGSDDDASLDSADQEERAEEEEKAKDAFGKLSKVEGGESYIIVDQFGDLFESMGSTYCEEEHKKTLKRLKKDANRIYQSDFLVWYIDWLFGDEDSSDDDSDEDNSSDDEGTNIVNNNEGLGDIFKIDVNSWRCDICSVRNNDNANQCVACETPRPGAEVATASNTETIKVDPGSSSSIGVGGFSFGGTTATVSAIGAGGFSFGGTTATDTKSSAIGAGGFSFGEATGTISSSGFKFGTTDKSNDDGLPVDSETSAPSGGSGTSNSGIIGDAHVQQEVINSDNEKAARVFDEFDSTSSGSVPVSTFEDMSEALGEGFHGDEYDAQVNLVDPSKSGEITRSAFLTWYKSLVEGSDDDASLDSADQEERAEEEEKAKDAFGKLSKVEGGESYIIVDQFGDLFESMGSTYCEEEHKKTLKRLKKDTNRIYQSDFLVWYIDWLFGDEDSSDDDSDDEGTNIVSTNEGKDESLGLGSIFKIDVNSWRCDICSVRNNDNANQCVACETPRPGAEVVTANNTAKVDPGSSSSIGVGGFSFGETATTDTKTSAIGAGGFSFGGESNATSTSSSGGFKFGTTSNVTSDITKTSAPVSGFSFKSDAATPTKKVSASSSTFAALPPMPSKAPTPFGATKPAEKAPAGTFAALPPMSSKAPSPFGAKTPKPAQQAPTSTFAALPPMPSKAPTPSGAIKPVKKAPTSTFAALPPMSSKAPSPFGSKPSKPVEKAPTSTFAALPPMPNKAPTPFGGIKPVEKAPASTFAALPPMSSKAPSPFGAFGAKPSKPVEKAPTSTFAALPPMSSKAPSPFGGAKISKPAEKAPASTFAALPPMSSKAPSPFGAKPSKPVEKVPSTFAALPPMSSKVPSPFGAKIPKPAEKAAVFTGKVASSQNATALVTTNSTLSGATIPQNSAGQTGKKKTKIQIQLDSVISSFSRTVAEVSQMRVEASLDDNELQQEIEDLATHIEQERSNILNLDDSIRKNRGETAFLLSRKTDSSRQIDEARKMIQEINLPNTGTESVVDTQGLDQESETKRRRFAASSRSIVRQMTLVRERVDLLEATSDDDHVYGKHKLLQGVMNLYKRSKYFEEVSSRIRGKINVASKIVPFNHRIKRVGTGRSTYGLESPSFKSPKHRNKLRPIPLESVEKVSKKQQQAKSSKSLASHWKDIESSLQQIGNENVKIDRFNTLTAKGATSNQQLRDRKKEVGVHKPMTHSLLMSPSASEKPSGNPRHENSLILSKRASMFSPPSKTKARNGWDQPSTIDQNRTKQLSLAAPRDLNQTTLSNASRETLASFGTTPEKLQAATEMKKKESTSSAEGQVHSSVGQTKRSVGAKAAFPPMSNKAPTNPFSNDKKRETVTSLPSKKNPTTKSNSSLSAPLPPMPKQAPKNPFSKDLTTKSKDTSSSTSIFALSAPKTSSEQQQNKIIEGKSLDSKKSEASSAAAFGSMNALGDSLLSSGSNKTGANPEPSFGAVQPISSSSNTTEAGKTNSYESILTSFYQKHNPTKIGEVKKTLEKFQGRESVLFEKLANKYKVPNPLEGTAKTAATGGSSALSGFGNLGSNSAPSAQPHSSGFGTTTGLASSPSPFASSSGTTSQQNPGVASSPFGSSASTSSSFGTTIGKNPTPTSNTGMFSSNPGGFQQAPAQSPFGSSTPSTNTSAFGISPSATNITAPSQSPFGGGNVASSSPFGAAATTTGGLSSASPFGGTTTPAPFGAPSPSPMQSNSQQMFNGRTARDLLLQFYQEKNPSKVAEVDKLLTKYRGNEEQMFRNLAKKYQLDCSVFGISSSAPNPGFGSPTVANPAFGQASAMGGGSSPFGQSPGGFGQPSSIGGGSGMSGSSPVGHSFGSGSTAGFGGSSNFGSLAQTSPSPFGGQSSNAPVFGSPPFGAARR